MSIGKSVDFAKADVHSAAGLLKLFFRELPEPLFPYELYDAFLTAISRLFCDMAYPFRNRK
jgi:hypothetical protein